MSELRELRQSRKIKQKDMATYCGVSQAYICALENGRRKNPSIEVIRKMAKMLGVKTSRVLDALEEAV